MAPDLELALAAADTADRLTLSSFRRSSLAVETKPDSTPVTEVDRGTESAIRQLLARESPADAVVGEEMGRTGSGDRRWVIDPIDGTVNFIRGIPVWATLIALEVGGTMDVGVVSAPALGRRWWAQRGHGAFAGAPGRPGAPIRVSGIARLADAAVSAAGFGDFPQPERLLSLALKARHQRGFGDFWQHMLVAEGAFDIGIDPVCSLWDNAALQVIVTESGGKFTDLSGCPRPDGGSAVSSNGLFHDEVIAVLGGAGGGPE
ncbi:MAG: inositol monophosphatase family protein [Acidimicrobiales bacterium]